VEDHAEGGTMSALPAPRKGPGCLAFVPLLSLALLAACGSARRGEPVAGPLALGPAAARGEKVFLVHCDKCHPGGEAGLGFALNNKPLPGVLIRKQVRWGLGAMPSFPAERISEGQLDDLVAYIKALRAR
jgi:mono/diheme cytochrome c family protein